MFDLVQPAVSKTTKIYTYRKSVSKNTRIIQNVLKIIGNIKNEESEAGLLEIENVLTKLLYKTRRRDNRKVFTNGHIDELELYKINKILNPKVRSTAGSQEIFTADQLKQE